MTDAPNLRRAFEHDAAESPTVEPEHTRPESIAAVDEDVTDLVRNYRLGVVRFGLIVSWVAYAILVVEGVRRFGIADDRAWFPASILGIGMAILTLAPWPRILGRRIGEAILALWGSLVVAGLVTASSWSAGEPLALLFMLPAVLVLAALAAPWATGLVVVLSIIGYGVALGDTLETGEATPRIVLLAIVGGLVWWARAGLNRITARIRHAAADLQAQSVALDQKEAEVDRLYAVSRAIGTGTDLAEVLPELIGPTVTAVGAKVGLVLLYRPDVEALEVMSPIWVAGHTVRAEGYRLSLTDHGVTQRVFTSGEPARYDTIADRDRDALLTDLEASNVAAVPLRIENKTIGVLLVADTAEGSFDEEDVRTLESLAGPTALVLNQLARYEEARETGAKMAELAQLKTDFVSVVSHELRTPLTSIIGSLRTLARPELAPTHPNAVALLSTAERQAQRLRQLIEDLLMVSRLDNQALPVRPRPVEPATFLRDVVDEIPGADEVVTVEVAPETGTIETDPDHLRRVLTNLIENALKYAPDSPVEVVARPENREVWISVIDHGAGIPYELHDHIFDRFTQVGHAEVRSAGGTGLGLSIVKGLSEAMGGRVWFEPTVGGGATFTIALPRSPKTRSRAPGPSVTAPEQDAPDA